MGNFLIISLITLLFFSCSNMSKHAKNFRMTGAEKKLMTEKDPIESLRSAQSSIDLGIREDLRQFAPKHLQMGKYYLKLSREFINDTDNMVLIGIMQRQEYIPYDLQDDVNDFHRNAALAVNFIKEGLKLKGIIKKEMKEIFLLKEELIDMKVETHFPSIFLNLINRIPSIIDSLEEDKGKYTFSENAELILDMRNLLSKVVIKTALSKTRNVLQQIQDEDLEDYALATLTRARQTLESTQNFFMKSPRDFEGINERGNISLLHAKHAYHICLEVKKIMIRLDIEDKEEHVEKMVLEYEANLTNIQMELGLEDIRDRSLFDQSMALITRIRDIRNKIPTSDKRPKRVIAKASNRSSSSTKTSRRSPTSLK